MNNFQFASTKNYQQDESIAPTIPIIPESRYFCAVCDRKLNDVNLTDDELGQFKSINAFTCNLCYQVHQNFNKLKDHQLEHFNNKDLKIACVDCTNSTKIIDTDGTLDEIYTKNDVRLNSEFWCELCNRCFDDKNQYFRHIRNHNDRIVYTCHNCEGLKLIGWNRWNIHKKTVHEEIEELTKNATAVEFSYKCSICSLVIRNISEFQKHSSQCHLTSATKPKLIDGDSIYCGVCCVEMPDIREIKEKLETEQHCPSDYYRTNFDTLNCLICHKVFISKGDLKDHQSRDHFESKYERRFACVRCVNKANKFGQNSNFSSNSIEIAMIPLFCLLCNKSIPAQCWSKHMRNHNDRVVYQCTNCLKIRIGSMRFQAHLHQSSKCSYPSDFQIEKMEKDPKSYTFQCVQCKEIFSRRSFKIHIEESDCYLGNNCKTCSKRFITKSLLNEHQLMCLKVNQSLKFDCTKCSKSFHTRRAFVQHSNMCRKGDQPEMIRCEKCNALLERESIDSHWELFHRRKTVVKLKRLRTNKFTLRKYISTKLTTTVQFGCLLCDESFADRLQVLSHMKNHYCDKAVQTSLEEDQCEMENSVVDTDSKDVFSSNMKNEMWEPSIEINRKEHEEKFQLTNEIIKTESTNEIEDIWTSDQIDSFADDYHIDTNDQLAPNEPNGINNSIDITTCCFCKNAIPDLINPDNVVYQQLSRYGECVCVICFQVFKEFEKLRDHELSHFQENIDGHKISCRLCAWSQNVFYTEDDFFRLEKEFQCYMCTTKTSDMRTLRRHKRSHLSLCVFTCKVCNKKSISDERHRTHLRKHQKPELTIAAKQIIRKCTICGDEVKNLFRDEEDIDKMFEKFGGGPCKICFTYISDKRRYISHERGHMEDNQLVSCFKCCNTRHYTDDEYHQFENELKCFICNTKLSSLYNLHLHKRKHLDRVVYSCSICLSLVVGTRNNSHHMYKHGQRKKNREEEVGQFECHYCQKVFPHKSSLPAHFKQHLNKVRVPCPQCTLTFASKGNLTQHIKQIHLNIRKHICELCGKAFGHPHNLKSHMVKHSGEKPYQCPICFKKFGYYSRMKTHAWIHSGLKPYKCDQCDKCYNDSTDLRRHKRIHGGVEKKFECELCKIKFYEHKYLRAHRASAHKFLVQ